MQLTFVPCLLGIFPWLGAGFEITESDAEAPNDSVPNATWLSGATSFTMNLGNKTLDSDANINMYQYIILKIFSILC